MGSGGSSGGKVGSTAGSTKYTTSDNTVEVIPAQTLRTDDIKNANYKSVAHEVLNVSALAGGEIDVSKARRRDTGEGSRKYPIYEYDVKGAYIVPGVDSGDYKDNRDATETKGVNWNNVKAVSGATFEIRPYLKQMGFKWNGSAKKWVK